MNVVRGNKFMRYASLKSIITNIWQAAKYNSGHYIRVKTFKNGPSKICGGQTLKNSTWSILEYPDPHDTQEYGILFS